MGKKKDSKKDPVDKLYKLQNWHKHQEDALERQLYSIKRMDVMVVSLSGACIYIVFQTLRFLNSPDGVNVVSSIWELKVAAIAAVLAIIVNFASQIFGSRANKNEALYADGTIKQIEDDEDDEDELKDFDNKASLYGKLTSQANFIAIVFMIIAIVFLVIYNLLTF